MYHIFWVRKRLIQKSFELNTYLFQQYCKNLNSQKLQAFYDTVDHLYFARPYFRPKDTVMYFLYSWDITFIAFKSLLC